LASCRSQLENMAAVKLVSVKSASCKLQWLNMIFFHFTLIKRAQVEIAVFKANGKKEFISCFEMQPKHFTIPEYYFIEGGLYDPGGTDITIFKNVVSKIITG